MRVAALQNWYMSTHPSNNLIQHLHVPVHVLTRLSGLCGRISLTAFPFLTRWHCESPSHARWNSFSWMNVHTAVAPLRRVWNSLKYMSIIYHNLVHVHSSLRRYACVCFPTTQVGKIFILKSYNKKCSCFSSHLLYGLESGHWPLWLEK